MIRLSLGDGSDSANWETYSGPVSAVTHSGGQGILGSPGEVSFSPAADGGAAMDGGGDGDGDGDGDAGISMDAGAQEDPLPIISELAWMGTAVGSSHEWIELYNVGPNSIVNLANFVLIEGTTERDLPSVSLGAGKYLVLEANVDATSLDAPDAQVVTTGLNNGGEILKLCRVGDLQDCDTANPTGADWFAGDADNKISMVRLSADSDGASALSWATWAGGPSTVLDGQGNPILGSPGASNFGETQTDGGAVIPFDAGPNEAPQISISSLEYAGSGNAELTYSATDDDEGDLLSVSLFYDIDDQGNDGIEFATGLPSGVDRTYTWTPTADTPGSYYVFAVVSDLRQVRAYAYSNDSIQIGTEASEVATFQLVEPDGVNDSREDGRIMVRWDLELPEGAEGGVSLFLDTDDQGMDGEPIATGFSASGEEQSFLWDPAGIESGSYTIYGVLDWTGGTEVSYSEFIEISGAGCGCQTIFPGQDHKRGLSDWVWLAILMMAFLGRSCFSKPMNFGTKKRRD